ncbi:Protein cereblon [Dirofilaria immitis]|nr:Protein cereblon [Dirofilaria immitis]
MYISCMQHFAKCIVLIGVVVSFLVDLWSNCINPMINNNNVRNIDDENNSIHEDDTESESTLSSDNNERERRPFDVTLPPTHQYLRLNGNDDLPHSFKMEDAGKIITVSILEMPIVLLPTQLLPFHTDYPLLVSQLRQAARQNEYIALKPRLDTFDTSIATLIQVRSLQENDGGISVQAVGRQRCRILNRRSAINGMPYGDVEVLEERELPSFSRVLMPISFVHIQPAKSLRYYAAMTSHSYHALKISLTKHYIDEIAKWLYGWHVYEKVRRVLSQGPTALSYWVAANLPIDMEMRLRLLDEPCTDRRLKDEYGIINRIDVIICKNCGTLLCNMSQMISVSTEGNSAHYVNPGGYVHDLFTVSEVVSTIARGPPSAECSWFPGFITKLVFGLTRRSIRPADSRRPITSTVQRIEQLAII